MRRRDGTATAGEDYTATSGTLSIGIGQGSATIEVPVTDDRTTVKAAEGDETFTMTLSSPTAGATLADATATGTIVDVPHVPDHLASEADTATTGVPLLISVGGEQLNAAGKATAGEPFKVYFIFHGVHQAVLRHQSERLRGRRRFGDRREQGDADSRQHGRLLGRELLPPLLHGGHAEHGRHRGGAERGGQRGDGGGGPDRKHRRHGDRRQPGGEPDGAGGPGRDARAAGADGRGRERGGGFRCGGRSR